MKAGKHKSRETTLELITIIQARNDGSLKAVQVGRNEQLLIYFEGRADRIC